jgi:hypothetical protein
MALGGRLVAVADTAAIDSLIGFYPSGSDRLDSAILDALSRAGDLRVYPRILDYARRPDDESIQQGEPRVSQHAQRAMGWLVALAHNLPDARVEEFSDSLLTALGRRDVVEVVLPVAKSRWAATAVEPIVEALAGLAPEYRSQYRLGFIAKFRADELIALCDHDDAAVREIVAEALATRDDARNWDCIHRLTGNMAPAVRAAVYGSLHSSHPDADSILVAGLADPDSAVVLAAAKTLADRASGGRYWGNASDATSLMGVVERAAAEPVMPLTDSLRAQWMPWLPADVYIKGLWCGRNGTAVAVGAQGVMTRWDGRRWQREFIPTAEDLEGVCESADGTLWIVGKNGFVMHGDGTACHSQRITGRDLYDVAGTSRGDLCAVGWGGIVVRFDGTDWRVMRDGLHASLHHVEASDGAGFLAAGEAGSLVRVLGDRCTELFTGAGRDVTDVMYTGGAQWLVAAGDLFRVDGLEVSREADVENVEHLFTTSTGSVFARGHGSLWRHDGARWISVPTDTTFAARVAIHPQFDTDGSGEVWKPRYIDRRLFRSNDRPRSVFDMWADPETGVLYAVDRKGLYILNDPAKPAVALSSSPRTLDGSSGTIVASGRDRVSWYRRDAIVEFPLKGERTDVLDVDLVSPEQVYVVAAQRRGEDFLLAHGASRRRNAIPAEHFATSLYVAPSGDAFVTCYSDGILRFDGSEWRREELPVSSAIRDIWGSDDDDVWAVAIDGVVLHFDGREWRDSGCPAVGHMECIWGRRPDDVFVGGHHGRLYHFDGVQWQRLNPLLETVRHVTGDRQMTYVSGKGGVARFPGPSESGSR